MDTPGTMTYRIRDAYKPNLKVVIIPYYVPFELLRLDCVIEQLSTCWWAICPVGIVTFILSVFRHDDGCMF